MVENYRYGIGISDSLCARGRANSCHSSGQGVLQRYIPCRCSVFSLGTPFFATRAKGGYASCHCVHRRPPLFSKDRIPIHVAFSLRPSIPSRYVREATAPSFPSLCPIFPPPLFFNKKFTTTISLSYISYIYIIYRYNLKKKERSSSKSWVKRISRFSIETVATVGNVGGEKRATLAVPLAASVSRSRYNKTWSLHSRRIHVSSIYTSRHREWCDTGMKEKEREERKRGEEGKLEANVRLLIDGTVASKGTHSREQSGRGGPRNRKRGRYSRRNYFRKGIARRDLSFDASRAIGWQSTTRFSYSAIRATEIIVQPYFHAIAWIAWSALG